MILNILRGKKSLGDAWALVLFSMPQGTLVHNQGRGSLN